MIHTTFYLSPVGKIILEGTEKNLVGLWIKGQKYFGENLPEDFVPLPDPPPLIEAKKWLEDYFSGKRPSVSRLHLAPAGGEFRQTVWGLLLKIPYGETTTYGQLAKDTAKILGRTTMSAQAVGGAVGHNPLSIIIPCHRVIGSNGNLTGYAGGLDIKIKLLKHEGVDMNSMFLPRH